MESQKDWKGKSGKESLESWKAGKPGKPESWKAGKPGKLESWKAAAGKLKATKAGKPRKAWKALWKQKEFGGKLESLESLESSLLPLIYIIGKYLFCISNLL